MCEDEDQPTIQPAKYSYSAKLVNRSKKSEYRIHNIRQEVKFTDMQGLKNLLSLMIYVLAT